MTATERKQKQEVRDRIKRKLYAYREAEMEARQIKCELSRLEAELTAPSTSNWDGMPHGGGYSDTMADKVAALVKVQERYTAQLDRLGAAQLAVEDLIDGLEPRERRLLRYRYINGLTWEGVCVEMSYSWKQTHNIHAKALDTLAEKENPEQ